jgi:hypothetical protein
VEATSAMIAVGVREVVDIGQSFPEQGVRPPANPDRCTSAVETRLGSARTQRFYFSNNPLLVTYLSWIRE